MRGVNDRAIRCTMVTAAMKIGQSYHARALATVFGISGGQMRKVLDLAASAGKIEGRTSNGVRLFSLPVGAAPAAAAKPLTISREMRAAQERCKELYVYPSRHQP